MRNFLILLIVVLVSIFAISVTRGVDKINSAKAYALMQKADQDAQRFQFEQQLAAQREAERQQVWNDTYYLRIGVISIFVLVVLGNASYALYGTVKSYVFFVEETAKRKVNLIYPKNGALPVIFDNPDNPRYLVNPDTGLVLKLTKQRDPDKLLVDSKTAIKLAETQSEIKVIK